jgi:hypothetical protein
MRQFRAQIVSDLVYFLPSLQLEAFETAFTNEIVPKCKHSINNFQLGGQSL